MHMSLMDHQTGKRIFKSKGRCTSIKSETGATLYKELFIHSRKSGDEIDIEIYSTPIVINDRRYRLVIAI